MWRPCILSALLWLMGCSTPYQEMGFSDGVAAQQVTSDTYRIVSRGNGYTGSTTIQDYTLLKAAETTKADGATHFIIVSGADASSTETVINPGQATTTFHGSELTQHPLGWIFADRDGGAAA